MLFVFNDPTRRKRVNNEEEEEEPPFEFRSPLLGGPCSSALVFFCVFSSLSREHSSQGSAAVQDIGETENKEERKEERNDGFGFRFVSSSVET